MSEVYQGESPNARLLAGAARHGAQGRCSSGQCVQRVARHAPRARARSCSSSSRCRASRRPSVAESLISRDIIWTASPGPGGGGGGGGNKTPEPPRKAELPDKPKITVPVAKTPKMQAPEPPKPEQQMNVPAQPVASGRRAVAGRDQSGRSARRSRRASAPTAAPGPARAPAAARAGIGSRPGIRRRLWRRRVSAGQRRHAAALLREVKPNYTADAMRAKIQGVVWLEAVVLENGIGRPGSRDAFARPDVRPRPGSRAHRQEVAFPPRHASRSAGPGA